MKENIMFMGTNFKMGAIQPIGKNDELYFHYGVSYWFQGGVKYPESRHATHIG